MKFARELVRQAGVGAGADAGGIGGGDCHCTADGYPIIERVLEMPAQLAFV